MVEKKDKLEIFWTYFDFFFRLCNTSTVARVSHS